MARDDHAGMKPETETLGERIQKFRKERAWSQDHLAGASNLSLRTIQRVENGKGASPETLQALAAAFEVGTNTLTSCLENPNSQSSKTSTRGFELSKKQAGLLGFGLLVVIVGVLLFADGHFHFFRHLFQ